MSGVLPEREDLAAKYGKRFEPPQLLHDMAAKGASFDPQPRAQTARAA